MKELSIEEKARAYDEALERAKNYWKSPHTCFDIDALTEMFPELKDTDDAIRKELIEYFEHYSGGDNISIKFPEWIAWLKKQGENNSVIEMKSPEESLGISSKEYNEIVNNCLYSESKPNDKVGDTIVEKDLDEFGYGTIKDIKGGQYIFTDGYGINIDEQDEWHLLKTSTTIEQNPTDKVESKFKVGDYIRNKKTGDKGLIVQLDIATKAYCYVNYDGAAVNHSDFPFDKQDEWELLGHKVAEQKLAEDSAKVSESSIEEKDMTEYKKGFECGKQRVLKYPEDFGLCKKSDGKIEPKFHEGDWLISNNKKSIYQVIEVKRGIYVVRDNADNHEYHIGIEESEKSGRLWTIQDAKDGDVLYSPSHRLVWIYKDKEHYYTCVNMNYVTENVATDGLISVPNDTCPATKDERTVLFEKIKEAGYELDAEKKELKKVEQLP